jgi:hypothetical protein
MTWRKQGLGAETRSGAFRRDPLPHPNTCPTYIALAVGDGRAGAARARCPSYAIPAELAVCAIVALAVRSLRGADQSSAGRASNGLAAACLGELKHVHRIELHIAQAKVCRSWSVNHDSFN